jgi:hypothetical protein
MTQKKNLESLSEDKKLELKFQLKDDERKLQNVAAANKLPFTTSTKDIFTIVSVKTIKLASILGKKLLCGEYGSRGQCCDQVCCSWSWNFCHIQQSTCH